MAEAGAYRIFSPEHIKALVDLVCNDPLFLVKASQEDLTTQYVIKMEGAPLSYRIAVEKGKLVKLDNEEDAPFVLSAPREIWEGIFTGTINPLVAIGQGKVRLVKGQLMQLARWFGSFNRMFELFKEIKIERV